jgi:AcrR family transcriptional regulator
MAAITIASVPDATPGGHSGRPRSEQARRAVLEAVDDLLVDVGYAAMTMKGIAERAGVGRQTVYRWWTTKAEILLEACIDDALEELDTRPRDDTAQDLLAYLLALTHFLTKSPAGLAYRALIGEAQHDAEVRALVQQADVLVLSTHTVLKRARGSLPGMPTAELASAQLTGPVLTRVLTGPSPLTARMLKTHVRCLLAAWGG